jgi:hypothetical protein
MGGLVEKRRRGKERGFRGRTWGSKGGYIMGIIDIMGE